MKIFSNLNLQIIVYESRNGLAPQNLYNMLVANSSDSLYNLRCIATDLKLLTKNSSNGQKCFSYNGANMSNSLLTESKLAPSLASFKKSLVHMTRNVIRKQRVFTTLFYLFYFYHCIFNKLLLSFLFLLLYITSHSLFSNSCNLDYN